MISIRQDCYAREGIAAQPVPRSKFMRRAEKSFDRFEAPGDWKILVMNGKLTGRNGEEWSPKEGEPRTDGDVDSED